MEAGLIVKPSTIAEAGPLLAQAARRGDTTGGAASIAELCEGGQVFAAHDAQGRPVLAYVLTMRDHAAARVCWVQAAAGGAAGHDLTREMLPGIERQASEQGAHQIAITTRRRGLINKLRAQGYTVTGVTLRKAVNGLTS